MRLATLKAGGRDGSLVVVATDGGTYALATGVAATMQEALDRWETVEPRLREIAAALDAGAAFDARPLGEAEFAAPLPRAWQWLDGSSYPSHGDLMNKVLGITVDGAGKPLMYQGVSDRFHGPRDDVPFVTEEHGIDFEGEFGVIVGEVPMGTSVADAEGYIRLVVQINDWSLRALAGPEMKTMFGWIQAKPPCSAAPFAVTADELGDAWANARPLIHLRVEWNGAQFGDAFGEPMQYGFNELIAHAAATRTLPAGTIIGSGTVSNANFREVGSSCIAERRGIEIVDEGVARTAFMRFGDTVRMEAHLPGGRAPFGVIEQKVVRA